MIVIKLTNNINDTLTDIVNDIKRYLNNTQNKQLEIENSIKAKENVSEFVIDRFEGSFAVCESLNDNKKVSIKKENLPLNAKEGNVLKYDGNRYVIDFDSTNLLKKSIKEITKDLWKN